MWFFMYACYVLSFLTWCLLVVGFFQGLLKFHIFAANHVTFMILASIFYTFTETLVIFFFVGTGVSIKEYSQAHKLSTDFQKRSLAIKRKVYPPLLLNMLFMIILFIMVGAVDTNRVSLWIYLALFIFCILDYIRIKIVQNTCFRDNTALILDMSGVK
jgi:hypothetical protein